MRVLQLCKKYPYPLKDGESIAVHFMSKGLVDLSCEVTLLTMNTSKHFVDIDYIPDSLKHYKAVHKIAVDNHLNIAEAFICLATRTSYNIHRYISKAFETKLIELLKSETFDIVQLETSYLSIYTETIRRYTNARIVLRSHNVEYKIWERMAINTKFLPKKLYLKECKNRLRDFEISKLKDYDLLVALSNEDLSKYVADGYEGLSCISPIGIDLNYYTSSKTSFSGDIFFIGSLDWMPNYNGLVWFLDEVWPEISKKFPWLNFHIAGRNMPNKMYMYSDANTIIHGEVEDAIEFMDDHSIMIVPLFSGSGMRVKILEGMALGKLIISTSIGCEGIEVNQGEHILKADDKKQFIDAIIYACSDPEVMDHFYQKGKSLVKQKYDNWSNARKLLAKYESLLSYVSHS